MTLCDNNIICLITSLLMDTTVFLDFSLLQIILQKTFLNIHLGTHTMSATYLAHIYPEYKYAQDKL